MQVHGALVEVLGVGVLLLGPSGVGKSETALELVTRGHRLVADDVVELAPEAGRLIGCAPARSATTSRSAGSASCSCPSCTAPRRCSSAAPWTWSAGSSPAAHRAEYERVGLERPRETLAGVTLPSVRLPVRPATNLGVAGGGGGARPPHARARALRGGAARRESAQGADVTAPLQVVFVAGLSGSGKTTVMDTLEDLGFYCVDNLPRAAHEPVPRPVRGRAAADPARRARDRHARGGLPGAASPRVIEELRARPRASACCSSTARPRCS